MKEILEGIRDMPQERTSDRARQRIAKVILEWIMTLQQNRIFPAHRGADRGCGSATDHGESWHFAVPQVKY